MRRPHDSQSSRENVTPSSGTSPVASYKEVPPPPGVTAISVAGVLSSEGQAGCNAYFLSRF